MITAIVTIIVFLVLVSIHEFGHFIVAKSLGFGIMEYAIGFGPVLFKKEKKGILYSIRALPLGGYCKFTGDTEETENDPGAFNRQKLWKRFLVIVAGAVFNVILGFIIFIIMVAFSSPIYTNTVDSVVEHSYLADAGIQAGDEIIRINGKKIDFYQDITLYTSSISSDSTIDVRVKRDGQKLDFQVKPSKRETTANYKEDGLLVESKMNGYSEEQFYPYDTETNLKQEDKIGTAETTTRYLIGFVPQTEKVTPLNILPEAYYYTKFVVKLVYNSLWDMVRGAVSVDQLSGPVGVVNEVNNAVHSGSQSWLYVLNLVALLSINLGVFNLLPIPALDGGRLLFLLIEWVRGKPIPPEKEGMVHGIGMLLLLLLIVLISFNDIMRLFGR